MSSWVMFQSKTRLHNRGNVDFAVDFDGHFCLSNVQGQKKTGLAICQTLDKSSSCAMFYSAKAPLQHKSRYLYGFFSSLLACLQVAAAADRKKKTRLVTSKSELISNP